MSELSHSELDDIAIARVLGGDVEAYAPVVARHLPALRAFVARHAPDQALADDLVQEALVVGWETLARFERGRDFGAWLRGIAANRLRRAWRRVADEARERAGVGSWLVQRLAEWAGDAGADERSRDRLEALRVCLEGLPAAWRRAVDLRYRDGLSREAIATAGAESGASPQSVGVMLFRARERLRECIDRRVSAEER